MNTHLKIALRNFYREKTYAFINIGGLALAVCCCLIVTLYLRSELNYDRHFEGHERIFRVVNEFTVLNGTSDDFAVTSRVLGPMLKEAYPEVIDYVRFLPNPADKALIRYEDTGYFWDDVYVVDTNVFEVFSHDIIYGDPKTALIEPGSIAVSERFARRYFGDENPIGKSVRADSNTPMTITLVFADLPDNTHLKYDMLFTINNEIFGVPEDTNTRRRMLSGVGDYTYLVMPEGYQAEEFEPLIRDFYEKNMNMAVNANFAGAFSNWHAWLEPLASIHLDSDVDYDLPKGNRAYLYGFTAVGLFILLVACINYINLATARATKRAKSVGMRKILGAGRSSLMLQFLGESLLFSLLAVVIGITLTEIVLTLSPLNELLNKELSLNLIQDPKLLFSIAGVGLAVGLISGLYPAIYLSSWAPISAMVGRNLPGSSSIRFRQVLVFIQFTITIAVIAATLLMATQMRYINNKSLGFNKENRVMITLRGAGVIEQVPNLEKELASNSNILGMTTSQSALGKGFPINTTGIENNNGEMEPFQFNNSAVGENYLQVMGIKLIAGRDFSQKLLTDTGASYIVNQSFVKKMGWDEPLGKRVIFRNGAGRVIGVVEDFNYSSLHSEVEPFLIYPFVDNFAGLSEFARVFQTRLLTINISGENLRQTLQLLEEHFNRIDPLHPFEFEFLDDSLNQLYAAEQSMMQLIGIFAGICILIACMGLFGVAVFTTEQRTKEIGIRKTLGASSGQIILLLASNVLALVIGGALVASVVAYISIDEWLRDFAYRADINPFVFVLSALFAAAVAYITIALQSYKTASADPVGALRYE